MSSSESEDDIHMSERRKVRLHPSRTSELKLHKTAKIAPKRVANTRVPIKNKRKSKIDKLLDDSDCSDDNIAVSVAARPASISAARAASIPAARAASSRVVGVAKSLYSEMINFGSAILE